MIWEYTVYPARKINLTFTPSRVHLLFRYSLWQRWSEIRKTRQWIVILAQCLGYICQTQCCKTPVTQTYTVYTLEQKPDPSEPQNNISAIEIVWHCAQSKGFMVSVYFRVWVCLLGQKQWTKDDSVKNSLQPLAPYIFMRQWKEKEKEKKAIL